MKEVQVTSGPATPSTSEVTPGQPPREPAPEVACPGATVGQELEREFIAAVLRLVGSLVTVIDREGRIVLFNQACERSTGYRFAEVQGRKAQDIFLLPAEQQSTIAAFTSLFTGRSPGAHECHWRARNGELRLISWWSAVLRSETGEVQHVIATGTDITEKRRAEELREHYLSLITHDLRQPLAAITTMADWLSLALRSPGDAQQLEAIAAIQRSAASMASMIQELVESASLEAGELVLDRQPADLLALVRGAATLVGVDGGSDRIQLHLPAGTLHLPLDANRLERALVNLLGNALKYSPAPEPVALRVLVAGTEVQVAVSDRGAGIPPADLPRIFDRFFRGPAHRRERGLGLGLYITRLIVEAHGGRIAAESTVGHGTTVTFTLPLAPGRSASTPR